MATAQDFADPNYQKVMEQAGALHPEYEQYQAWKTSQPGGTAAPAGAAGAAAGPANTIPGQAQAASTYSATPGAAPTAQTGNQGTQDVVRNSYLARATQPASVNRNDPNVRAQAEPFAAAQERARRQYETEQAERLSAQGLGSSGQMANERRVAMERAAQATGSFESQLVARELQIKRAEIADALGQLGGLVSGDQARALQMELAKIDAQLKQAGLDVQSGLGSQELALKDKLGTGGLNIDLMRLLQGGQQFNNQLGFNIADREAYWNNAALQNLL